jgi:hypothetical protein
METVIDRPAASRITDLGDGLELRIFSHSFSDGGFTNVYDLSWHPGDVKAVVRVGTRPADAVELAHDVPATTTAAFFVLLDKASGLPAQTSLNLVIDRGRILGLPVADREALLCRDGVLSMDYILAEGQLVINGTELTWAGSRSGRDGQSYVYGNGHIVITRRRDPAKGSLRVLDEASRLTPAMPADGRWVDVGFVAAADGGFRSAAVAPEGGMDIFGHDLVVRLPAQHVESQGDNRLDITRVGSLRAEAFPESAVTVGPSLDTPDFPAHPINRDLSLDVSPTFVNQRKMRTAFYQGLDGRTHIRLFDARPGSPSFQGVTPVEARDLITADTGYQRGCFLDGGQTGKMWVVEDGARTSYGNRHYLRWPVGDSDEFVWVPDRGRPIPSVITIQPRQGTSSGVTPVDYSTMPGTPQRQGLHNARDLRQFAEGP